MTINTPKGITKMPDAHVMYVERICTFRTKYYILSITLNFLLITACAGLSVRVRHVPDHFNEAKFIGLSILCIGLLIVAFVLVFVTTTIDLLKMVWIMVFMMMNMVTSQALLLYPKLFAIYCLTGRDIHSVNKKQSLFHWRQSTATGDWGKKRVSPVRMINGTKLNENSSPYNSQVCRSQQDEEIKTRGHLDKNQLAKRGEYLENINEDGSETEDGNETEDGRVEEGVLSPINNTAGEVEKME